ncbi:MAG TPA: DUF308 domain-containing protein [Candidatus Angelobacter sp.]|nr:DUF308 domain-containing protein [Candidatus Angelobacter sp.]
MLRIMIHNWWLFACRSAFALMFAAYIWFVEGAKLPLLLRAFAQASTVELFGLLAFGAGLFTLAAALRPSSRGHDRGLLLLDGLGTCTAGVVVVVVPGLLLAHLIWIIVIWALFIGVCEMLMARTIRRHLRDEWFLATAGAGSVLFGSFLLPGWITDDHILLVWLASYALFSALAMAGLAYRLWKASTVPQLLAHDATQSRVATTSE